MTDLPLKLLARDAEDIQVMAAVLQDAIVPVCDIAFRADEGVFVLVVQRFCWDNVVAGQVMIPANEEPVDPCVFDRISCAVEIEGVESVQFMGFNPNDPAAMLDLLTMTFEDDYLQLIFAGGGKVRLKLGKWAVRMQDFGEPWPTTHCPRHAT